MNRAWLLAAGVIAGTLASGPSAAADGKTVWTKSCSGCHSVLAPKFGDKAAWAPLVKKGADELTAIVVKGKSPMPPKGGAATEADVRAAVEYLISQME